MPAHPRLVATGPAARALHVSAGTLHRLRVAGTAIPAAVTDGGHARWDIGDLSEQLRNYLDKDDKDDKDDKVRGRRDD